MNLVEQQLAEIREEFREFEDRFDRYAYLVELAAMLPAYPESLRTEDRLVRGCQSHVWLNIRPQQGKFYFDADSDTLIIKGVLLLLSDLLNGVSVEEVSAAKLDLLPALDLGESFSDARQKGIGYIIQKLQETARRSGCMA